MASEVTQGGGVGDDDAAPPRKMLSEADFGLMHPWRSTYYFLYWASSTVGHGAKWFVSHRITLWVAIPCLLAYLGLRMSAGASELVAEIDAWAKFGSWWWTLGVLSSIGFGTGMHSGILFLFPYVLKVCLAAEACQNVDFDVRKDVWYHSEPIHCEGGGGGDDAASDAATDAGYWEVYRKVALAGMLWGAGTAVGEIPPYYMSFAASRSGREKASEALDWLRMDAGDAGGDAGADDDDARAGVVSKVYRWMVGSMVWLIRKYGFIGVFLMSSWPNALFDVCGIVCGYLQMSFLEFFGAVFLGKALVKVNAQTLGLIFLFRQSTRDSLFHFLARVIPAQPLSTFHSFHKPFPAIMEEFVNKQIVEFESNVRESVEMQRADETWWWQDVWDWVARREWEGMMDWREVAALVLDGLPKSVKEWWNLLVLTIVLFFVLSVIGKLSFLGYEQSIKRNAKSSNKKKN